MESIIHEWGAAGTVVLLLIGAVRYMSTRLSRYATQCEADRKTLVARLDFIQDRQHKDVQEIFQKVCDALNSNARAFDKLAENERRRITNETATRRMEQTTKRHRNRALIKKAKA